MKIMIIEDDATLASEMDTFLKKWGYDTVCACDFKNIVEEVLNEMPQLVLMDINLPYYDGFYWCGQIRRISKIPIIYISSRNDDRDKIMAIAQGGDDYVEKPFRLELLKAKIESILRRTYEYRVREQIYISKDLSYESASQTLRFQEKVVELTKSERTIMGKLMEKRPDVVTRDELMMELWSTDEFVSDGTLTTVMSRLRSKLVKTCGTELIQTRKGQGYYIL